MWDSQKKAHGADVCSTLSAPKTMDKGAIVVKPMTMSSATPFSLRRWALPVAILIIFMGAAGAAFAAPAKVTLTSPSGVIGTDTPTFTWNSVQGATWYYLWVNNSAGKLFTQWYQASAVAKSGVCSAAPGVKLENGTYRWWVEGWNSQGYGPWSAAMSFTVGGGASLGKANLTAPSGQISDNTPTYRWRALSGATWYYLWINNSQGKLFTQWYQASEVDKSGVCSVTPNVSLQDGSYRWWIMGWNSSQKSGPWSTVMTFNVVTTQNQPGGGDTGGGTGDGTGSHAGRISTWEGTKTCLQCHTDKAKEAHASVHYQWRGDASEAVNIPTELAGKLGGINDFCIYPDINWIGKLTNTYGDVVDGGCAKCHAGLGEKPASTASQTQLENIDCLVCHSDDYKRTVEQVNGAYRFVPDTAKMTVDIVTAAQNVHKPTKDACLNCHTKAGGGNNFKRGDIEEAHRNATRDFDVHLASKAAGGAGLSCLDCHTAKNHKIAGRGSDLRPRELPDEVSCYKCHTTTPHDDSRLNKHTARVYCTVCHIPAFAKIAATDMDRNWSAAGDLVTSTGLYEPHHTKGTNVKPEYRFFNGDSEFYVFGDAAVPGPNGRIVMSAPLGNINDSTAKIYAFKRHQGTQPIDPTSDRLLPLKIGVFFSSGDIDAAVKAGAEGVGWGYNGHSFATTERYMGLFHEVAPKSQALSCADCHGGSRLNFNSLGYTPVSTRNGRALCASCHEDKSNEWNQSVFFTRVHQKHVDDKRYNCNTCHNFSAAQ